VELKKTYRIEKKGLIKFLNSDFWEQHPTAPDKAKAIKALKLEDFE
jgi:hypothetical protein